MLLKHVILCGDFFFFKPYWAEAKKVLEAATQELLFAIDFDNQIAVGESTESQYWKGP